MADPRQDEPRLTIAERIGCAIATAMVGCCAGLAVAIALRGYLAPCMLAGAIGGLLAFLVCPGRAVRLVGRYVRRMERTFFGTRLRPPAPPERRRRRR